VGNYTHTGEKNGSNLRVMLTGYNLAIVSVNMHKMKRWIKRAVFRWGMRPIFRDTSILFVPRLIWKTPPVKGKRLVLKRTDDESRYRKAWNVMTEFHETHMTAHYSFDGVKHFPHVRGKRTQLYLDNPSLRDLVDGKMNRRVKNFLRENQLTFESAHRLAIEAFEELSNNTERAFSLRMRVEPDYINLGDQFIVSKIGKDGKLHLVMVDI
jgi:hypothetical protein